jgi:AraC family transcriptional regulator
MDDLSPLAMEGLALELLVAASRHPVSITEHRVPAWLRRVTDMLQDRFAETFSLADLAATVEVCPDHLARVFRRYQGCTVGEHVRRLRVDFARRRLASSDATLVEIALAAGFTDQSHLTKTFKQHTGMTPGEFRACWRSRRGGTRT